MKAKVYNLKGEVVEEIKLPSEIFSLKPNFDLIHQVLISQMARRRTPIAHTKTRKEVKGGGRKPWPQKGTGRARHGSIRSPIWRGGGVVFGPRKERIYKKKIPKKMKRKALLMVLSEKAKEGEVIIVNFLNLEEIKTKKLKEILLKLPCNEKSTLIALPKLKKEIILSARNLEKVSTILVKNLNVLDLLNKKYLILEKKSIEIIKETFLK